MTRLSIDDIFEQQLHGRVPDPVVAEYVSLLGKTVDEFVDAANKKDWPRNYESALETCRITQQMRLEVGELCHLDRVSGRKIGEILGAVEKVVTDLNNFATHYPLQNRRWGVRALKNISQRLEEVSGFTDQAKDGTNASPDVPKKG